MYTKRSGSRGGRDGVYGEPATVSDMPTEIAIYLGNGAREAKVTIERL